MIQVLDTIQILNGKYKGYYGEVERVFGEHVKIRIDAINTVYIAWLNSEQLAKVDESKL